MTAPAIPLCPLPDAHPAACPCPRRTAETYYGQPITTTRDISSYQEQHVSDQPEAHPTRDEYVVERLLSSGRWLVESSDPAATAQEAEGDAAWFMDPRPDETYRTVRRTITSVIVAVRPGLAPKEIQ